MGRREQRERERKRAASTCQTLDRFLPAAKRVSAREDPEASSHCDGASLIELEPPGISSPVHPGQSEVGQEEPISKICDERSGADQDVSLPVSQRPTVGLSKPSGPAAAECVDVGLFVKDCKSEQEVAQKLQELPQEKKYALLTQHKRPPQGFQFPTTFVGGCNRSFRPSWLSDHRWLAYSTQLDGAFCVPCALFNGSGVKGRLQLGKLVTRPFRAWQKMSEKFAEHQSTKYHQACMELADDLKRRIEHPQQALPVLLDQRRAENIEKNRAIVKSLARAVLFCGRQCIALRGGSEQLDTPGNPGNFLALVRLLSEHDELLRNHLESPALRNVTYVSPTPVWRRELVLKCPCHASHASSSTGQTLKLRRRRTTSGRVLLFPFLTIFCQLWRHSFPRLLQLPPVSWGLCLQCAAPLKLIWTKPCRSTDRICLPPSFSQQSSADGRGGSGISQSTNCQHLPQKP